MSSDSTSDLRRELLDDFYAECDELLSSSRAGLGQLENPTETPAAAASHLEAVFRQVHTLKGISSIVGLRTAEQVAHGMEDILRQLSKHELAFGGTVVDALLTGLDRFEQIVAAQRLGQVPPAISDVLEALGRLAKSGPAGAPPVAAPATGPQAEFDPAADLVVAARARGLQTWLGVFTPTPALDQRGINVASVRARLAEKGEILSAKPIIRDKGIVFEFVVGCRGMPPDFAAGEGTELRPLGPPEEEGAAPAAAPGTELLSLTPSHVVRVDLSRLDDLMRIAGEMVIHRSRLDDRIRRYGNDTALRETNLALARSLRELREGISRVRLVPVAEIFTRMPLVVRQLARNSPKRVRVDLEGQQTPIDKYLVERLKEPLLHLVRNAFSHGIETAEERAAAGKPPEATILLRATSAGESIVIQVRDDGRGVDPAAIAAKAAAAGLPVPASLEADALLAVLCTPGFSTRDEADLASGRGVGMAVVASTLRELGGTLSLSSTPGSGTEFTLRLPLTLSIIEAIIVTVGDEVCAVPQGAIAEILHVAAAESRRVSGTEVVPYRGGLLPVTRLRDFFHLPPAPDAALTLLVLRSERGTAGLAVDRVRAPREVVVRPLLDPLVRVPGVSGATELGDGRPILILDPAALTRGAFRPPAAEHAAVPALVTS